MQPKILFFSAYGHVIAGSQKQMFYLLSHLKDYDVQVLLNNSGALEDALKSEKVIVHILPLPSAINVFGKQLLQTSLYKKIWLTVFYLQFTYNLAFFLKKNKVDIIHCFDERAVLLSSLATKIAKVHLLWYLQTENSIGNFFWKVCLLFSDFIIYNGEFAEKYTKKYKNKAQLIYSINSPIFEKTIEINWVNNLKFKNKKIVGIFSSVIPFKGYHILLETLKDLKKRDDFIVISLGGFPEEYSHYQQWLLKEYQKFGIDNITFVGWYPQPYNFMQYCDIVLLPSIDKQVLTFEQQTISIVGNEGFPTVVTEALEHGIPVVATKVGSTYEQIIDGYNGFLIEPANGVELTAKLEILLDDDVLRAKFGAAARKHHKERFSRDNFVKNFEAAYSQLLKNK